jgi:hypothetical protein
VVFGDQKPIPSPAAEQTDSRVSLNHLQPVTRRVQEQTRNEDRRDAPSAFILRGIYDLGLVLLPNSAGGNERILRRSRRPVPRRRRGTVRYLLVGAWLVAGTLPPLNCIGAAGRHDKGAAPIESCPFLCNWNC